MNKLGLAILAVLALSLANAAHAQDAPHVSVVKFSLFDAESSIWTNITMQNLVERTIYETESGDDYLNGLQGELYFNWYGFDEALVVADFGNLTYDFEGAPNMIVDVSTGGVNRTVEIKELPVFVTEDLGITKIVNMLTDSLNRATGLGIDHAAWPVDLQMFVL